ncbi:2-C-methyl-D-erythritol 2,4-cyclodiphosphate synthase [Ignatzschineria cameli]|uniref:2-C-methyl-D-erythritol 2,4-cyclodiphosphate synthase n=1 Tax=Ignatzschineria cameli TaxID=2182793 RepID=A0A2U2ARJ7_9GAMM|nr:2-C-methyl-D-erythritol 2,4-cyclodiphosphate synthase [Ignatzschineria cameli]PWD83539.1 2-C-methyl-D-erythritol 2,4-cyclodiphosphate synthase [Ignatzschineria cameli]PWD86864.1 2-C-methyl-D-erythritol 2,4-cyclodiphosphate synthase [Ignatzschineria cameli]PWD91838.1 2-C-methyl-D-erythritol 2,4-cyclodiphosphate synthase [Ignatzschineria cameli]PWD93576.1 2-C-methyl-D-erythritol 2,4-cyclodiphosphate synthase [Ignatzschineria cameli]PWD94318.1 2-C-methyl-D-erythritol 2,4-cyclodiphosphate synth
MMRIGFGFDVHTFQEGDHLMLGGVKIPFHKAFKAHSDGDVVLHALTDALLGAVKGGDIGTLFPDTDPRYKGADSRHLLKEVYQIVRDKGYEIGNIDITIMAEAPKMKPYREAIESVIAEDLAISVDDINVKATTMEKLGFVGREEGIAAQVALLLKRR